MSNAILSYPDRTLAALLSGGSWQASAPLTNLQIALLSQVARSTNALAASSIIQVDIGGALNIRVMSLCAHNISAAGTIRARGYSDAGYTTMVTGADTGTVTAWPAGFTAQNVLDYPKNWTFVFSSYKTARYWKFEITDTGNAAGYIEVGRCWIGEAWEPATGVSYGMSLGYESRDVIEESLGGVPWGEKRTPRRSLIAKFETLTTAEKRQALILQKVLTETDEAFWVSNGVASAEDILLEAFPCFMRKPSPLTYPYYNNHELSISIIERV
jgi:hypothetical protein